ncbi:MAG: hypothetical protein M1840_003326 [Geoglossum simile]|nr:MAG: hypothetical protein M1840_003326 [Geoglossum simile]
MWLVDCVTLPRRLFSPLHGSPPSSQGFSSSILLNRHSHFFTAVVPPLRHARIQILPFMASYPSQVRALYRSILRELPRRSLSSRSLLHQRIRRFFSMGGPLSPSPSSSSSPKVTATTTTSQLQQAQQFLHYVRAQRMYATLLERYNPSLAMEHMADEERVRLTARRVGLGLPEEVEGKY